MSEEKKPKIDLKARLGKMGVGGQTPPPPGAGGLPAPPGVGSVPPAMLTPGGSVPVPPPAMASSAPRGLSGPIPGPVPPPPGMPMAAASSPFAPQPPPVAPAPPAPPPQPQRIEVDELTVLEARKGAKRQGLVIGAVLAVFTLGIGYVAGGASEKGDARTKSRVDAKDLAADVNKAKDSLKTLADKLDAARNKLVKDRQFPAELAKELGGINVDFDGGKLAGRRFSGFSQDVTFSLVEFITNVQGVNDRKAVIIGLLNKLQKPLTEQFAAPADQRKLVHVVVIDKDSQGNAYGLLAPLSPALTLNPQKPALPDKFTFTKPGSNSNAELARYKGGDALKDPTAIYLQPASFDKVCPSETAGQAAQLAAQMGNFLREINGDKVQQGGPEIDTKPGMIERAQKLADGLTKVSQ